MSERIIPIDWRERTEQALRSGLTQFAIMAQRQILRDEILAANPNADLSFFSDADETPQLTSFTVTIAQERKELSV